ncbi:hypothetical protein ACFLUS_02040 [Chloroflexota bacterium]
MKTKVFLGVTILVLLVLLPVGCVGPTTPESPEDARDAVFSYLRKNVIEDVPTSSTAWDRRDFTSKDQVTQTTIEFIGSDYWEVTVSYPSRSTEYYVYNVLVTNHKSGWHWQGEVRLDGGITETSQEKPDGTLTAAELLSAPIYDTEIKIYGRVDGLGELACLCFFLISGRGSVQVWYDTMVENDGTVRPAVSVDGIRNGDKVIVTGELKGEGGIHYSKDDFWAKSITVPP